MFFEEISRDSPKFYIFEEALEFEIKGGTFVVTTLNCFAVPISDLLKKGKLSNGKGVALWILNMNRTTSKPIGKLLLPILGAVYWRER